MGSRIAGIVLTLLALTGCTTAPGMSPGGASTSPRPATAAGTSPVDAARRLLAAEAADVSIDQVRQKRSTDPVETLISARGRIEPALGRGHVSYDVSGLLAVGAEAPSQDPAASVGGLDAIEIIWTPDDLHVRPTGGTTDWESRSRAEGRRSGGLIGRLPDEVLGLVRLVADSDADRMTLLEPAALDGATAQRWLISIPVGTAVASGVPAEFVDAAALEEQYGISSLPVEVWLVDSAIRRLRLAIHRDTAPSGGSDTTTTTYDWLPPADRTAIEVPT